MTGYGIFIEHKTKTGRRDEVFGVWKAHMADAVNSNPDHLDYFYGFSHQDPDMLLVFQRYTSQDAARSFLRHSSYLRYLSAVDGLLAEPPTVRSAAIEWIKTG